MTTKRYDAYASGPDEYSTYPQCWGRYRTSLGDSVVEGVSLTQAIDAAQRDGRAVDIYLRTREGRVHVGAYFGGEADRVMRRYLKGQP